MLTQFSRTELLFGKEAMDKLAGSKVAVFGIGGVGGYVCEALVRSGVGAFDLIDDDKVCLTNLNRQIIATRSTVGKYKTDVMRDRMLDINPNVEVEVHKCFFLPENADDFPWDSYDYVVDAVDTVTAKIALVMKCKEKNIPIIMVSAKKDDIDKIRGLGLGADDYITKPFSPSELVARVKAHLARYERLIGTNVPEGDIVEIRGIKIDKTARRVWVNGEEKQFTTKEFDLLTFLAENPNHVFTKEELFREIWDMESIGDIATVTVHIKKIREKIEMNTAKPQYIETIWGVGYRFKL